MEVRYFRQKIQYQTSS